MAATAIGDVGAVIDRSRAFRPGEIPVTIAAALVSAALATPMV
ncbi:MAG TPA: hypothetical protein VG328_22130 [Stellaceae bacterium]|jgi:hypothetical protein|nr:hypothetical protein [Stellaceae bacterium]